MRDRIRLELKHLIQATQALHREYPAKLFTLDGRLVGDIGEVLAEREYDLKLLPGLQRRFDAKGRDGKNIQITIVLSPRPVCSS